MKSVSSGFVLTSFCLAFCADVIFGGNCDEKVGGSEAPTNMLCIIWTITNMYGTTYYSYTLCPQNIDVCR